MLQVQVTSSISQVLDGAHSIAVEAQTISELMRKLADRYPRLQRQLDEGIAVSINGQIYRDNWQVAIPADAEVYLLPRIPGG
ncbi:MAG: molybdopterin synthase sulfur carrier subunit [Paraglaciecola psychrophila]|jgi:molybdopterin synthase sulfur carrier subunit